jgi:hypothetical protein
VVAQEAEVAEVGRVEDHMDEATTHRVAGHNA